MNQAPLSRKFFCPGPFEPLGASIADRAVTTRQTSKKRARLPLPLLVAVPALLGAGATGIKKGVDGYTKLKNAKRVDARARATLDREIAAVRKLENDCELALAALGDQRLLVFTESMPRFIVVISRVRHAEVAGEAFTEQMPGTDVPVGAMHDIALKQIELLGSAAGGVLGAVAASQVATTTVTGLAFASTGTAISGLGGAAASNATLAWLGGGTLLSGGFGVSGGAVVLGGIAAAPALLVGGFLFDRQMTKLEAQAATNAEEVESAVAKLTTGGARLLTVTEAARGAVPLFELLRSKLDQASERVDRLADGDEDVRNWSDDDQQLLRSAGNLAGVLVALACCPVIDDTGELDQRFKAATERAAEIASV